ncbi:hypothetical protein V8B55DRAFT_1059115 [Mucor lusitanicus]|uniref:Uncharacterized protein n=1 Tax=Mucor circinelloides f. lusitanicus TaxID=29924 RepID=A0A8H4B7N8_MUCCL|nr:hypothetical protein FB192DRAFT_1032096 [Mucor lusitanicus]
MSTATVRISKGGWVGLDWCYWCSVSVVLVLVVSVLVVCAGYRCRFAGFCLAFCCCACCRVACCRCAGCRVAGCCCAGFRVADCCWFSCCWLSLLSHRFSLCWPSPSLCCSSWCCSSLCLLSGPLLSCCWGFLCAGNSVAGCTRLCWCFLCANCHIACCRVAGFSEWLSCADSRDSSWPHLCWSILRLFLCAGSLCCRLYLCSLCWCYLPLWSLSFNWLSCSLVSCCWFL